MQITNLGPGFRYRIFWSPDSKKIVWVDQTMTINILDMESKVVDKIDQDLQLFEGDLRGFQVSWSPNSAYVAYDKSQTNGNDAIYFYDVEKKTSTKMTSGFYSTFSPTFDPSGDYLYCYTNNAFDPEYSDFDNTWIYPNATKLAMFTLRKDVESPMKPSNDTVAIAADESDEEKENEDEEETEDESETDTEEDDEDDFVIDFEGFSRRMIELPPHAGNVGGLAAVEGKVIYLRTPNTGEQDGDTHLKYFDLEESEEKTIISDINGFQLSADGSKLLVFKNGNMATIDISPGAEMEDMIPTSEMEMTVNPKEEWMQIFNDAWRFQRDFFYDTEMHGVDWPTLKERYGAMIADCSNRADVNFVIGELIGELNASHTYRGGGDQESAKTINVGYLGVDWSHDGKGFKIEKIIKGADWDTEVRSPLDMPGVAVEEGDYVLAVNGVDMSEFADPYEALEGMAGKTVELTVNSNYSYDGAKKIMIEPLRSETRLRNLAWIEANRKRVDEASGGKIGYIYVPSTGVGGQNELVRQFYGQWDKEGLIIDERFNNGGQIPDRFIELLNRKPLAFWDVRDGENWQWPPVANFGSMAMLINGWAGSGGDAFPDYFRKADLGPLIGTRTWGGLIGISGAPSLIDGGVVTVPTFRMYNPDGSWFKEGHGVDPDIEVPEDPGQLAKGIDTQLERAIKEVMTSISAQPKMKPSPPAKEKRT